MADAKSLSVDLLRLDAETQNRLKINEETVEDYAELIAAERTWPLGSLDVFHDGTDYYVADGFHRTLAAKRAKRSSVPCNVHKGTAKDARIFGMTANDQHGMRMSRADKRSCVEWLLDNEPKMTQAEIANKSGVSLRSVKRIVVERKPSVLGQKVPMSPNFRGGGSSGDSVAAGREARTSEGTPRAPKGGSNPPATADSNGKDLGKCPNCGGSKWKDDEFGLTVCAKCKHPHGEPAGDVDEGRAKIEKKKWIKTIEADMRAADDVLRYSNPKDKQFIANRDEAIRLLKLVLQIAREWPA